MIRVQLSERTAYPQTRRRIALKLFFLWHIRESFLSELFPAFRPELFDGNGIHIGSESGSRFVVFGTAKNNDECFLGEFFGSCRIVQTSSEESVDRIPITFKKQFKCGEWSRFCTPASVVHRSS